MFILPIKVSFLFFQIFKIFSILRSFSSKLSFIEKYRDVEDLGLKWDLVKMEIRGFTVKFSKTKARKRRDDESSLQKKINELFIKAEKNRNNRQIVCELNSTRARLEKKKMAL